MPKKEKKILGFSLIELLLSVWILFLLFTMVNYGFLKKQRSMEFEITKDELYNQLYEAREHSRHFRDGSVYGVRLENDRHTWFKGNSYSSTGVIVTSELPNFLEINSISLNGWGEEIVFEKNTGKTANYGEFKIVDDSGKSMIFEINSQGLIKTKESET